MRVQISRPSRWLTSFFLLYCLLLVLFVAQPSNAQSPTPTPLPTAAVTWGPVITNTPSILTGTPPPTPDRTGCVDSAFDESLLDPLWISQCFRCLQGSPTPVATIKSFTLATSPPIGTPNAIATLPTLPPLYEPPVYVSPTATLTPTMSPTGTPELIEYYFDLRQFPDTFTIIPWSSLQSTTNPVNDAVWIDGDGFQTSTTVDYEPSYTGQFALIELNEENFGIYGDLLDEVVTFALYSSGSNGFGITLPSAPTVGIPPDASGFGGDRGGFYNAWNDVTDVRGMWAYATYLGTSHSYLTGFAFTAYGYAEGEEPTPTPTPTSSAPPALSCLEPQYIDISEPIVFIDDLDGEFVAEDCFEVLPPLDITVTDPDIYFGGVDMCITWVRMPLLSLLGIQLSLDLILIIPIAFIIRRMFTM